jgi:hypothetical protein
MGLVVIDEHPEVDRDLFGLALSTTGPRDEYELDRLRIL